MESKCGMDSACAECCECNACNDDCRETMTMNARVLRAGRCELLVCDLCSCQEYLVHSNEACCFCVGECVCITYNGAVTMSIPPQISAISIRRGGCGNGCRC